MLYRSYSYKKQIINLKTRNFSKPTHTFEEGFKARRNFPTLTLASSISESPPLLKLSDYNGITNLLNKVSFYTCYKQIEVMYLSNLLYEGKVCYILF